MSNNRKIRQCPHCKSNEGFEVTIYLGGHHTQKINFKGKIISEERVGTDDIERDVRCLSCGKLIDIDKVEYNL